VSASLESQIKEKARQLGFTLVGITTAEPPPHLPVYENWLTMGRQATMDYLSNDRARAKRADPKLILPECQSIIVLGLPYTNPKVAVKNKRKDSLPGRVKGRVAAYAWGTDYHLVIPEKLKALVTFIEARTGQAIPNRCYTDTGPLLERDFAMRAGLGWIGKNTCLINPKQGSYFLLSEILLAFSLESDTPFVADHCGTCTRCIDACPTNCILPDRTLDARRCISFLTIENKTEIPEDQRPEIGDWIFGCDICQTVCPWNERFAAMEGDPALAQRTGVPNPDLANELSLSREEFNKKFKDSPIKRAKWDGYLRNIAVALGNIGDEKSLAVLKASRQNQGSLVKEHIAWAINRIQIKKESESDA
jgi:epoxyqueuosine reductase